MKRKNHTSAKHGRYDKYILKYTTDYGKISIPFVAGHCFVINQFANEVGFSVFVLHHLPMRVICSTIYTTIETGSSQIQLADSRQKFEILVTHLITWFYYRAVSQIRC